jgi:hypothetical protein
LVRATYPEHLALFSPFYAPESPERNISDVSGVTEGTKICHGKKKNNTQFIRGAHIAQIKA